ncbi:MAG: type II toxin-antitoxin system RelE/ParE family toxin [Candidatus Korobacteraceae bacterium]
MAHRLAPEAETELDNIWDYLARESGSIEIADRVIDSITHRFFLLATHPHLGRYRDGDLRPGLRSFAVGEYVILYRVEGQDVLILHVLRRHS